MRGRRQSILPEGPLAKESDRRASIALKPGGSAANQAAWLASFGVEVDFAGRVGAAEVQSETYLRRRDRCDGEAEFAAIFSEAKFMRRGGVANSNADFDQRVIRAARR